MTQRKLLGAVVKEEEYNKVIKFVELYNSKTGKDLSLSKFIYMCVRYFIMEFHKRFKDT